MIDYETIFALKEMIRETIKEEIKSNSISVAGVEVASANESLSEVEKTAQKLINNNQDFLLARNKLRATSNYV